MLEISALTRFPTLHLGGFAVGLAGWHAELVCLQRVSRKVMCSLRLGLAPIMWRVARTDELIMVPCACHLGFHVSCKFDRFEVN